MGGACELAGPVTARAEEATEQHIKGCRVLPAGVWGIPKNFFYESCRIVLGQDWPVLHVKPAGVGTGSAQGTTPAATSQEPTAPVRPCACSPARTGASPVPTDFVWFPVIVTGSLSPHRVLLNH